MYDYVDFRDLLGKTITSVEGMVEGSDEVRIRTHDGETYLMHHHQDCCESVYLVDVIGRPHDLLGVPVTMAEVETGDCEPIDRYDEACQWTFYKLATVSGYVTLRWLGQSNGWYGIEVDFEKMQGGRPWLS